MSILRLLIVAAAVFLTIGSFAAEPKELRDAKQAFQKQSPHPTEADRARYVSKLVHLRQKLAAADKDGWQAVDVEIMAHPAPANSDAAALSKLVAVKWQSPRHEYLYKADGTWTMLPEEEDGQKNTNGKWRIEGNQFFQSVAIEPGKTDKATILLLDEKNFVYTDGENISYYTRLKE